MRQPTCHDARGCCGACLHASITHYAHHIHTQITDKLHCFSPCCRMALLEDMWEYEAAYMASRHRVMLSYFTAYRHAEDWGVADVFVGLNVPQVWWLCMVKWVRLCSE